MRGLSGKYTFHITKKLIELINSPLGFQEQVCIFFAYFLVTNSKLDRSAKGYGWYAFIYIDISYAPEYGPHNLGHDINYLALSGVLAVGGICPHRRIQHI